MRRNQGQLKINLMNFLVLLPPLSRLSADNEIRTYLIQFFIEGWHDTFFFPAMALTNAGWGCQTSSSSSFDGFFEEASPISLLFQSSIMCWWKKVPIPILRLDSSGKEEMGWVANKLTWRRNLFPLPPPPPDNHPFHVECPGEWGGWLLFDEEHHIFERELNIFYQLRYCRWKIWNVLPHTGREQMESVS